jgi:hypothetical protein
LEKKGEKRSCRTLEGYKVWKTEENQSRTSEVVYSTLGEVLQSSSHRMTKEKAEELEKILLILVSQWEHDNKLAGLYRQSEEDSSTKPQWKEVKHGGKRKNSTESSRENSGDEGSRPTKRRKHDSTSSSKEDSQARPSSPKTVSGSDGDRTRNRFVLPESSTRPRQVEREERRRGRSREKKATKGKSPPQTGACKCANPETPSKREREEALELFNKQRNRHQPSQRTPPPATFTSQNRTEKGEKSLSWREKEQIRRERLDANGISKNYMGKNPRRDHLTYRNKHRSRSEETMPQLELTGRRSRSGTNETPSKKTPPTSPKTSKKESAKRPKEAVEVKDEGLEVLEKQLELLTKQLKAKRASQKKAEAEAVRAKAAEQLRQEREREAEVVEERKLETARHLIRTLFGNAEQGVLRDQAFTWQEAEKKGFKFSELDRTLAYLEIKYVKKVQVGDEPGQMTVSYSLQTKGRGGMEGTSRKERDQLLKSMTKNLERDRTRARNVFRVSPVVEESESSGGGERRSRSPSSQSDSREFKEEKGEESEDEDDYEQPSRRVRRPNLRQQG